MDPVADREDLVNSPDHNFVIIVYPIQDQGKNVRYS